MQLTLQIKTKQKLQKLEFINENSAIVSVRSQPIEGKANAEIIKLLSKHYKIPQKSIKLIRGAKSKTKTFEISR